MPVTLRVLMIEDDPADRDLVLHELRRAGFQPNAICVDNEPDYLLHLDPSFDLVLADHTLSQLDALRALDLLQQRGLDIPFIIVSGTTEELAIQAIQHGATDYLLKDRLARLGTAVQRALEEKRLRSSEERFRLLVEDTPDLIYRYRFVLPRGFEYVSPSATAITGYTPEEHYADPDLGLKLAHPDDRDLQQRALSGSEEITKPITLRWIRKDGKTIWIEQRNAPIFDTEGKLIAVQGIARDITECKRAEKRDATRHRVTRILSESKSFSEATPKILEALCDGLEWDWGELWKIVPRGDRATPVLRSFQVYQPKGPQFPDLERLTHEIAFAPGEGLPGRVWQIGAPLWIPDIRYDGNFPRAHVGMKEGLLCALGFPLKFGGQVTGIISLLSREPREPDPDLTQMLVDIGSEVSEFILREQTLESRRQSEKTLKESEDQELVRRNQELSALNQIGQALSRLAPPSEILELVYTMIGRVLDNRNFYIALYDTAESHISFPIYTIAGDRRPRTSRAFGNGITEYILRTKSPLLIRRDLDGALKQLGIDLIGKPARSFLGVPMLSGDKAIGVIATQDYEKEDVYDTAHVELLSTFASQAAIAIENARLYANTRDLAEEFRALHQVAHDLSIHGDLPTFLQAVAENAATLLNAPAGGIVLYNAERNDLEFAAIVGLPIPIGTRMSSKEGFAGYVFQTREPFAIDDYSQWEHRSPQFEKFNLRALVGVPLIYRGEAIGVLQFGEIAGSARKFTEADKRLLTLFAGQTAGAIHNARLLEETNRRADEFAALHQVTRDLSSYDDLPELLQTILERATELFGTPSGSVMLYDSLRGDLELAAAKKFPIPIGTRLELGVGLAGIVAQKREPLIVDDYQSWEHRMPPLEGVPYCAALAVPMIYRGELIGTLGVRMMGDPSRKFTEADTRLLSLFASQAASAVRNARLFEETKTRADQMALLYDAGLTLNRVLDPKLQLQFLVKIAMKTLKADRAIFYRYDAARQEIQAEVGVGYSDAISNKIPSLKFHLSDDRGISAWVLRNRLPLNLSDLTADRRYIVIDPDVRSGLWVPVEHEEMPRGVLSVFSTRLNAFTPQDERLLLLFASQVSVAMGNAALFEEINHRLVELEAINKLSTALRAAQTLEEMFPLFLDKTLALFETVAGVIWLYDPASGTMNQVATRGWFTKIEEMPMKPGEGIAGHVFATGQVHLSREFASDPLTRSSSISQIPARWGGACVPIRSAQEIVGVLFVAVELPRELNGPQVSLLTTLAEIAGNTIQRMRLHESLGQTFVQTVAALARAIDARDAYTRDHSTRVSDMAVKLAKEMGLPRQEQEAIRLGGLLHDIGKIAIPDSILHKADALTPEDWAFVKRHPVTGAEILGPIEQLKHVVPIVRHHQEKFDGTGYPDGLAGESIPMGARILSLADAFSSITDQRAYRKPRSEAEALAEIERCSGTQFDPQVIAAFRRLLKRSGS